MTVETRVKRARALKAIHELRPLTHVIDIHQLTKDPEQILYAGFRTKSSPKRDMDAFAMTRYLDYSSEMLSLAGKVAALYAQGFSDPVVLAAVNEVENLTTGLSRKIWQKIMILHTFAGNPGRPKKIRPLGKRAWVELGGPHGRFICVSFAKLPPAGGI